VARTARRDVIGLLIERQVTYTELEADALIAEAKRRATASGRTVRAEAELLLSGDREDRGDRGDRLRDLRLKVTGAVELLAAITVGIDDLVAESGGDDGELIAIMTTMAASCAPFTSVPTVGAASTTAPDEPPVSSTASAVPTSMEPGESSPS
jgi:hypothetical protein